MPLKKQHNNLRGSIHFVYIYKNVSTIIFIISNKITIIYNSTSNCASLNKIDYLSIPTQELQEMVP